MSEPKYLRYLAHWYGTGDTSLTWRHLPGPLSDLIGEAEVWHLCWMYEYYALPIATSGIAKLNVQFTVDAESTDPSDVLGIAEIFQKFDGVCFQSLSPREQQKYYLDQLHAAVLRAADYYGWEKSQLNETYDRIVRENYRFAFFWKKPVASRSKPKKTTQLYVEAGRLTNLFIIFRDEKENETNRVRFITTATGSGIPDTMVASVKWINHDTVKVLLENNRDYWLCREDGLLEFHDPRAEAGEAQFEYRLGQRYCDPLFALHNREQGLALIRSASEKGYAHATRYLQRALP